MVRNMLPASEGFFLPVIPVIHPPLASPHRFIHNPALQDGAEDRA
jgi:hypothetical protein